MGCRRRMVRGERRLGYADGRARVRAVFGQRAPPLLPEQPWPGACADGVGCHLLPPLGVWLALTNSSRLLWRCARGRSAHSPHDAGAQEPSHNGASERRPEPAALGRQARRPAQPGDGCGYRARLLRLHASRRDWRRVLEADAAVRHPHRGVSRHEQDGPLPRRPLGRDRRGGAGLDCRLPRRAYQATA